MARAHRHASLSRSVNRVPPYPTVDEIASRAHELFVSHGRRLNDIPEHWRAAEQELLERAARSAIAQAGPPPDVRPHADRRKSR